MIFDSVFDAAGTVSAGSVFLALGAALASGVVFAAMCFFRSRSTGSFHIATALLPTVVALVIILVNGNIGAGVAIAGAFSLVRFRSASGTAKEICIIFISMAAGLAFGMGYLAYGALFLAGSGILLIAFEALGFWNRKPAQKEKNVRITLPENLDYTSVFDDVFRKYTEKYELVRTKTTNMGSLCRVDYRVVMKDPLREKEMIDDIRTRNGNLEVLVQRTEDAGGEAL